MQSSAILNSAIAAKAETFQQRVLAVLDARGQTKVWLAKQLDMSKQAVHYLLVNSVQPKYVSEIANALEVNPDWLLSGIGPMTLMEQQQSSLLTLPVLTMQGFDQKKTEASKTIVYSVEDKDAQYFAVQLDNPSMEPMFHEESVLVFKKSEAANSGDYVLFDLGKEHGVVFRQYIKDGKDVYFKALNSDFRTIENQRVNILGVLVESRILL